MIYIRTCAYNAQKTLKRAIDSVLDQTYPNFEYHILDNGSTDRTRKIIQEYAKEDQRIVPYYNQVNRAFHENPDFWNLSKRIPQNDYFCILDADDAYEPTFFEEMLNFLQTNDLGMAACGTIFLDAQSGKAVGGRVLPANVVVDTPEKWNVYFPAIHWNLRQVWGKLYTSKAAFVRIETELPDWWPKAYGGDTVNVLESVKAARNFGVYAKPLHTYTLSKKSVSHQWIPGREQADVILHHKAIEFLEAMCGKVSKPNLTFLYAVYFHALKDTLLVLFHVQLSMCDKLVNLKTILTNHATQGMFVADMTQCGISEGDKQKLFKEIFQWLEHQSKQYTEENIAQLSDVYMQFNLDFTKLIPTNQLLWYVRNIPQVLMLLVKRDYDSAMEQLSNFFAKHPCKEIFPVELAQRLSALLQKENEYILYSKLLIKILIKNGDKEHAQRELLEWEQMLPEDEDLKKFRRCLFE